MAFLRSLSCASSRGGRSEAYTREAPSEPKASKNFWEIDGFENAINRCNDGNTLSLDFTEMISERAKIEDTYAKALKSWQKKWSQNYEKEQVYGTTKIAFKAVVDTADKVADVHASFACRLTDKTNSPVAVIKDWLKVHYGKSHIHFKKRNEFNEAFRKAQESWAEYMKKLDKLKKEYHDSVKLSIETENERQKSVTNHKKSDEQRHEAKKNADQAKANQEFALKKYQDTLKNIDRFRQPYVEEMKKVFVRTQDFEKMRLDFFKSILAEFNILFADFYKGHAMESFFKNTVDSIAKINSDKDVEWWAKIYGADMNPTWPAFVEYRG